jgi:hypothetical protein
MPVSAVGHTSNLTHTLEPACCPLCSCRDPPPEMLEQLTLEGVRIRNVGAQTPIYLVPWLLQGPAP